MKYLITGAHGFVGNKLLNNLDETIACPSLKDKTYEQIKDIITNIDFDVLIHTAAISDISECEKNTEASYKANVTLPIYLAKICKDKKCIFFSSDQVYSGCDKVGPYKEEDACPLNTYSKQKYEMENEVLKINPNIVLLRAAWMYDYQSNKGNFYLNVLNNNELAFSNTQYRCLAYLKEVVDSIPYLVKAKGGVYNYGSTTNETMYDLTNKFLNEINLNKHVNVAPDRHNLWMDTTKLNSTGFRFSNNLEGLLKCYKDDKE